VYSPNRKRASKLSTITFSINDLPVAAQSRKRLLVHAFVYLLWRDLWVTIRDWRSFLALTLVQPIFFLFVFGSLLPRLGQMDTNYSAIILPGVIGLTTALTAMTS